MPYLFTSLANEDKNSNPAEIVDSKGESVFFQQNSHQKVIGNRVTSNLLKSENLGSDGLLLSALSLIIFFFTFKIRSNRENIELEIEPIWSKGIYFYSLWVRTPREEIWEFDANKSIFGWPNMRTISVKHNRQVPIPFHPI